MSWGPEGSGSRLVLGSRRVGVQASPGQTVWDPDSLGSRQSGIQTVWDPDSLGSRQSGMLASLLVLRLLLHLSVRR